MGSEIPSIPGRENDVLKPRGGEEGSCLCLVLKISQSLFKNKDGEMYIVGGFIINSGR